MIFSPTKVAGLNLFSIISESTSRGSANRYLVASSTVVKSCPGLKRYIGKDVLEISKYLNITSISLAGPMFLKRFFSSTGTAWNASIRSPPNLC